MRHMQYASESSEPGEILRFLFPAAHPDRPWTIVNQVADANKDGIVTGKNITPLHILGKRSFPDGKLLAPDLGAEVDGRIVRTLRAHADAVMWGAETLRRERNIIPDLGKDSVLHAFREHRRLPKYPRLLLVTNSGEGIDFSLPAFNTQDLETIILTGEEGARQLKKGMHTKEKATVLFFGADRLDMKAALCYLREKLDVHLLLCEGGISLIRSLLQDGYLDEAFITTSPIALDPSAVEQPQYLPNFAELGAKLLSESTAGGFKFRRWRFHER